MLYSSTCLYYAISGLPPVLEPILVLNGYSDLSKNHADIIVNNVCFPSQVNMLANLFSKYKKI